jgi:hypothetical protein
LNRVVLRNKSLPEALYIHVLDLPELLPTLLP